MELRAFVANTIRDVIGGVQDAQQHFNGTKIMIASNKLGSRSGDEKTLAFDVAVTVTTEREGSGGGRISVMGLTLTGEAGKTEQLGSVSRVQFEVDYFVPALPHSAD